MAIAVFSDGSSSPGISPRISFSHDLPQSDAVPVEECVPNSSSVDFDFDFCVFRETRLDFESSSATADEIFSNWKILPLQFKQKLPPSRSSEPPPVEPPRLQPPELPRQNPPLQKFKHSRAIVGRSQTSQEKHKSFRWFNCIGGGTTLCLFPLMSRSNSAGSPAGGHGKHSSPISNKQRPSFRRSYSSNSWQRQPHSAVAPPLLKRSNSHGYYNSNNKINFNPVLNLPRATSTTNLFSFISIFSIGKDKSCKKKH